MSRISRLICGASRKRYWDTSHRRGVNPLRTDFHRPGTPGLESAARVHRAVCDGARCGRRTPTITSLPVGHFLTVGRRCERCRGPRWRYPRRAWPLVRCVGDCVAAAVACTVFWCAGRRRWGCCRRQTVLASVLAAVTALAALSAPLHVPGAGGNRSDRDCRGPRWQGLVVSVRRRVAATSRVRKDRDHPAGGRIEEAFTITHSSGLPAPRQLRCRLHPLNRHSHHLDQLAESRQLH